MELISKMRFVEIPVAERSDALSGAETPKP
jgi:hypothetical protein